MRDFGNLMNRIQDGVGSPEPVVGMGVTVLHYSDRHAGTIIEVVSPTHIVIQEDFATRTDHNGMSEIQEWAHTPNPNGYVWHVTKRKTNQWVLKGESLRDGTVVRLGERDHYYDFGF